MQQQQQTRSPQPETPVVEEMPVVEPADLTATDALLDAIDEAVEEATEAGDDAILSAVADEPVRKVHAGTSSRRPSNVMFSSGSRAWSSNGSVD